MAQSRACALKEFLIGTVTGGELKAIHQLNIKIIIISLNKLGKIGNAPKASCTSVQILRDI